VFSVSWNLSFSCFRKLPKSYYELRHVCPSVRLHGATRLSMDGFSYLNIFRKSVKKIQVSLKSEENNRLLYMKTGIHLWSYLAHFFLE
jgi:hypothetical protein